MMNAEPSKTPRRKKHLLRWMIFGMALCVLAGAFVILKWGDSENIPGFVKILKLRGKVFFTRVVHGRDSEQRWSAPLFLSERLAADGSYGSLEKQYRALLALDERVSGTNDPWQPDLRYGIAECIFLQGKRAEAAQLIRTELAGMRPQKPVGHIEFRFTRYWLPLRLAEAGRREDALSVAEFVQEQSRIVFKDKPAILRELEEKHNQALQQITNAPPSNPSAR